MDAGTQQTGRYRLKRCDMCGETFAVTAQNYAQVSGCPACRRKLGMAKGGKGPSYTSWLKEDNKKVRRKLRERRAAKLAARKLRDQEYEALHVPVTVTVDYRGVRREVRGHCAGAVRI